MAQPLECFGEIQRHDTIRLGITVDICQPPSKTATWQEAFVCGKLQALIVAGMRSQPYSRIFFSGLALGGAQLGSIDSLESDTQVHREVEPQVDTKVKGVSVKNLENLENTVSIKRSRHHHLFPKLRTR